MTYELVKELKDAGFQQRGQGGHFGFAVHLKHDLSAGTAVEKDSRVYVPTLSELIEACGPRFKRLAQHYPGSRWNKMLPNGHWSAHGRVNTKGVVNCIWGHTPEEAVARLWLSLNQKK